MKAKTCQKFIIPQELIPAIWKKLKCWVRNSKSFKMIIEFQRK